ncbi:thiosulfohydrolase SoxB [Methylotuvimicrobium buryatense]|uniref:Thiosulfohydrolase SoxB n=1 Tax=Methylotuvimicrobium buryatense TaxID=95641 RepID=A0A4P9UR06_METBY|nr:thiosulfohydrolase SoxB [Methylotuvimicrobium buryatense]QCW83894.1 thiosulfohydrolase SoxB [Methylotuvimicrobium buryatense]
MNLSRREFLQALTITLLSSNCSTQRRFGDFDIEGLYSAQSFGNVRLLHFTDCHAQLLPVYYREPSNILTAGERHGHAVPLSGQALVDYYRIKSGSPEAYAFTHLHFIELAEIYGKMGGFAHLATLIELLRGESGPGNTLLLDGGDSWQGSATALWTQGRDMVAACNLLGVDVMTGHWEFTYGSKRVLENLKQFNGEFAAQNIALTDAARFDSDDDNPAVFKPYVIKTLQHARVAVIGQAFPYTPIANPKRFVPDWQFGIQEHNLQAVIDQIKTDKAADVIVLLSHNGLDVDLKLASRVSRLDIILGGHTHDALPKPILIDNSGGKTWVSNAGSHGKFLAVLDLDVGKGRLKGLNYRLLPIFSNLLPPDPKMQKLIETVRNPYIDQLAYPLATADRLLYRRDRFHGTFDQLILDALLEVSGAEIAMSPGFRWGNTLLPGQTITLEDVMNHTAITYPETYMRSLLGREIKAILEDIADNLFNKDPYYRQGGDMVRVGGFRFNCDPNAEVGRRISGLRMPDGKTLDADKTYKVAGWAGVGEPSSGKTVWEVVVEYLGKSGER